MCMPSPKVTMPAQTPIPDPAPTPTYAKFSAMPGMWMQGQIRRVMGSGASAGTTTPKVPYSV